jgi:hypothetical protein
MNEAPSSEPPPGRKGESNSMLREYFARASRWFWDAFGVGAVADDIKEHRDLVKEKARVLWVLTVFVVLAGLGGVWIQSCRSEGEISKARSESASNHVALQIVQGLYQSNDAANRHLEFQLVRAENERDNARAKLAPFEIRAAQLYTNELPTEALSRLYRDIQPDTFIVQANGILLTNNTTKSGRNFIDLRETRALDLSVRPSGRFPMKGLTLIFSIPEIGLSNIVTRDWSPFSGSLSLADSESPQITSNVFSLVAVCQSLVPPRMEWRAYPISFSTNVPFGHLRTLLKVYTERSEPQEFDIQLNVLRKYD